MSNFSSINELLPQNHVEAPVFDLSKFQTNSEPIKRYDGYKIPVYNANEFDIMDNDDDDDNYQQLNNIQLKMEPHEYQINNQQTNLQNQYIDENLIEKQKQYTKNNLPEVPLPMELPTYTLKTPQEKLNNTKIEYEKFQQKRNKLDELQANTYHDRPVFGNLDKPKNNIYSTSDYDKVNKTIPKPLLSSISTGGLNQKVSGKMKESISMINYKDNDYLPEKVEKRKLSNVLYNSVVNRVRLVNDKANIHKHFKEKDVISLIKALGLNKSDDKWSKNDKKKLAKSLKLIINKLSTIKSKKTKKLKVPKLLSKPSNLFEKTTDTHVFNLSISSVDRDLFKYPNQNSYQVNFSPPATNSLNLTAFNRGFIGRSFSNIYSIELVSFMYRLKDKTDEPTREDLDSITDYPYILLYLDELGGRYEGTNDFISKAFCQIPLDNISSSKEYFFYNPSETNKIIKIFDPIINLNKLTVSLRKPDGELIVLSDDVDIETGLKTKLDDDGAPDRTDFQKYKLENTDGYPYGQGINKTAYGEEEYHESWNHINNSITLKVTCYNRKLNTMFLGKRDG